MARKWSFIKYGTAILGLFLLASLLLTACSDGGENHSAPVNRDEALNTAPVEPNTDTSGVPVSEVNIPIDDPSQDGSAPSRPANERMVIQNASLTIVVDDPAEKTSNISSLALGMGGWVISSNLRIDDASSPEPTSSATITIRVPAARLAEALDAIKSGIVALLNESITGEDVTQEFVDSGSRIRTLQATENRLFSILETANTTSDILTFQREITSVQEDIEILQGRVNYLREASAYSSISVTILKTPPEREPEPQRSVKEDKQTFGDTFDDSFAALTSVLQAVGHAGIVLGTFVIPMLLIFGVPGYLIYRVVTARWLKPTTKTSE